MAFAELGDRVAVHHRDSEALAKEVLAGLPGSGHLVVGGDLADSEIAKKVVESAISGLGTIDVLVNNAGVSIPHSITELDFETWRTAFDRTIAVNLSGQAYVTYFVVQHMLSRGGRIVNVSSRGAFRGEPDQPGYGASKAGLNGFGQSLARALAPHGISVGTVAPGWVATDMAQEEMKSPRGAGIAAQSPFNRIAEPEEVAAAVVFLASPRAAFTSGAIIDVNGASYLRT